MRVGVRTKPIQDDGSGPRSFGGAEQLAGERLEVLGEATLCDLISARLSYLGGAIGFPGPRMRPPMELSMTLKNNNYS